MTFHPPEPFHLQLRYRTLVVPWNETTQKLTLLSSFWSCDSCSPHGFFGFVPPQLFDAVQRITSIHRPSQQMKASRLIHWNTPKRRKAISSLFALTFLASVVTVSTSNGLPCPARHDRRAYLDSEGDGTGRKNAKVHVVEKKQRRWIEETRPTPTGHWPE